VGGLRRRTPRNPTLTYHRWQSSQELAAESGVDGPRGGLGGAGEGVAVGVEGHLRRGVAEQGPGGADVDAAGKGEGGRRVPEVVEADLPDSRPGKRPLEPVQGCLGVQVVAVLAAEDEVEVMLRGAGLQPLLQLALTVGA